MPDEIEQRLAAKEQALTHSAGDQDRLGTASNWSTFDTYLDHGMVANAVKHDRIDQAAQAASVADQRLAAIRSDLADLAVGQQIGTVTQRLDAIDAERLQLITQ